MLSCSGQEPIDYAHTIKNSSFNQGTIHPWEEVIDSTCGVSWLYDGRYQQAVIARGTGSSNLLMQDDFPAGTYTVDVSVKNSNPVVDITANGIVEMYNIDPDGLHQFAYSYRDQGVIKKRFTFIVSHNFNLIGFRAGRIGQGDSLEMAVNEFRIGAFKL